MEVLAELIDADVTLILEQHPDGRYRVHATRCDGMSLPVVTHDCVYGSVGEAIKAIMVFYVSEWESIFLWNKLSDKLKDAITAR